MGGGGGGWVACEIILSSPGTGGTPYSHFPSPKSRRPISIKKNFMLIFFENTPLIGQCSLKDGETMD